MNLIILVVILLSCLAVVAFTTVALMSAVVLAPSC